MPGTNTMFLLKKKKKERYIYLDVFFFKEVSHVYDTLFKVLNLESAIG